MTNTVPTIDPKARFELREAAAILDVGKASVLRWTSIGRLRCGIKKSNGRKFWTGAELIRFWKSEF